MTPAILIISLCNTFGIIFLALWMIMHTRDDHEHPQPEEDEPEPHYQRHRSNGQRPSFRKEWAGESG